MYNKFFIQELYEHIEDGQLWKDSFLLRRNDYLKTSGSIDTNLYFIVSGSVQIGILDDCEPRIIRFGYQYNFITALDSFLTGASSDLYIQALKKTVVKVIEKEVFLDLLSSKPSYESLWNTILQQLILQQLEREKDILISSPKIRYKRVLQRSPQLFQQIPHKYIALYLRMTPETLSRLQKS